MKKKPEQKITKDDGRFQRTLRSRKAILESTLNLYEEGNLLPTAQEVADRSGLGIRTVFRHFSEMEKLYIEGNELLYDRFASMQDTLPIGDLDDRIEQIAKVRALNCEKIAPFVRANLVQYWRSESMRKNYKKLCKSFRDRLFQFIPELKEMPKDTADAADLALSFENWNRLRHTGGMSQKRTIRVMHTSLQAIVNQQA